MNEIESNSSNPLTGRKHGCYESESDWRESHHHLLFLHVLAMLQQRCCSQAAWAAEKNTQHSAHLDPSAIKRHSEQSVPTGEAGF